MTMDEHADELAHEYVSCGNLGYDAVQSCRCFRVEDTFLRYVGNHLQDNTASQPRRHDPPHWEP
jgi:hypothetical protein